MKKHATSHCCLMQKIQKSKPHTQQDDIKKQNLLLKKWYF